MSATGIGFSSGDNVEFATNGPFGVSGLSGTQDVQVRNGQNLTFVTPAAPSGHGVFEVCNAAGCSPLTGASVSFTYYEPVRPVVEHISPTSGPAGGGGFVAISGTGLGTVESVSFGAARSPLVTNPQTAVGTSDTEVVAAIPPGNVGASVRIKVTTEVGTASGPRFRYKRSAPAAPGRVEVRAAGGSIAVSWKASASDGGSPLTGYVVSAIPKVGLGLTRRRRPFDPPCAAGAFGAGVRVPRHGFGGERARPFDEGGAPRRADSGGQRLCGRGQWWRRGWFRFPCRCALGPRGRSLPAPVVGLAATPDAQGYWLAGADGSVYAFGTAQQLGSLAGDHLRAPIVGIVAAPYGGGYWLVGAKGSVTRFGTARFFGSLSARKLTSPVVGMAATPDGGGYWLVTANGTVYPFGDAKRLGSLTAKQDLAPVVAIMADPMGAGYWLVSSNGGVFNFGEAKPHGSLSGRSLPAAIVAAAPTPGGGGYWLLAGDGHVYGLGRATAGRLGPGVARGRRQCGRLRSLVRTIRELRWQHPKKRPGEVQPPPVPRRRLGGSRAAAPQAPGDRRPGSARR